MQRFRRIAAAGAVLALALTGSTVLAHSASAEADVVGHVYVNDNTAPNNSIAAFNRHADGSLTPLRKSPYAAGGSGAGARTGSQGALQISSDGRFLLAVDAGSNGVSVLRIFSDGSLEAVTGSPVWSGGTKPVSIAVHGNLVYVANTGDPSPNISGFTLNSGGHLAPLANSTITFTAGSNPSDVLFNGNGTNLATALVGPTFSGPSAIASFSVGADGRLTAAPGSPFPAQAPGTIGSEFRPTDPTQLFVSNAHAGAGAGSVSSFSVATDGTLTAISGSPFADNQTAPCWVEISHDGQYLFTVNTASGTISRYSIASDGTLTLLGSTAQNGAPGLASFDARLDPTGGFLYVVDAGVPGVSEFSVSGGNLTELSASPIALPAGATPFGIVVN